MCAVARCAVARPRGGRRHIRTHRVPMMALPRGGRRYIRTRRVRMTWHTPYMTTLKQRLQDDLTTAIKGRDELRSATLRLTLSALTKEEVAGERARELSDDEVLKLIAREAKKRREAAEAFEKGGRDESAERERAEGEVLAEYLPKQLGDEELAAIVGAAIEESGAQGPKAMGAVMKIVNPKVAGRAEGGRVAAEVRRQLAG
jgi:uncharacterized protein